MLGELHRLLWGGLGRLPRNRVGGLGGRSLGVLLFGGERCGLGWLREATPARTLLAIALALRRGAFVA
jgi:hypothetical protein